MDEDLSAEIRAACEAADLLNAELDRDGWLRARERARRSAPAGVDVDEWLASRPVAKPPRPAPQQQSTAMDAATQAKWDRWADKRTLKMIGPGSKYFDAIAEALSMVRREEREHMRAHVADEIKKLQTDLASEATKLREEISGLRIDEVVGRSVLRGEINELRETRKKKKVRV